MQVGVCLAANDRVLSSCIHTHKVEKKLRLAYKEICAYGNITQSYQKVVIEAKCRLVQP